MRAWFPDDDACLDYLDWLRWPEGFVCPHCGCVVSWEMAGRVWRCGDCRRRVSRTAGTIFQDTRTPLTVWFAAAWLMTTSKAGLSALELQRLLDLGSYQTAWTMLHRFRAAMGTTGTDLLVGEVEVDETELGGPRPGPPGRGALGKTLVAVAVELNSPKGFGRARMRVIPDASKESLRAFLTETVAPGSLVITDGWRAYPGATEGTWSHKPLPVSGSGFQAHELLPGVHRVAALYKRWVLGTHQGSVGAGHIPAYLDEFVFRFNRRKAAQRGLLFYRLMQASVGTPPVTYRSLVVTPQKRKLRPVAPAGPRQNPDTLALPPEDRPWRQTHDLG